MVFFYFLFQENILYNLCGLSKYELRRGWTFRNETINIL